MSTRWILATSLSLCLSASFALVGCASAASGDDAVAGGDDALSASSSGLVGSYATKHPAFGGLAELVLDADKTFTSRRDGGGTTKCVIAPCEVPESGTWSASKRGDVTKLTLRPSGGDARIYVAERSGASLSLTRDGNTEVLTATSSSTKKTCGGFAGLTCGAGEECVEDTTDGCDTSKGAADCPGICVPKTTKKICGGIAGLTCGAGEKCVEDTTDGCDTSKGAADCPGVCVPKS